MKSYDIVIGRTGESITGRVLDSSFEIRTSLGPITVPTRSVRWIHFENPPEFAADEIWTAAGDRLIGTIRGTRVHFKPQTSGALSIVHRAIHTILISPSLDPSAPRLLG